MSALEARAAIDRLSALAESMKKIRGDLCVTTGGGTSGHFVSCGAAGKKKRPSRKGKAERELERFVANADIELKQLGGGGQSAVFFGRTPDGNKAVVKVAEDHPASARVSKAISGLMQLDSGLADIMPPMHVGRFGGDITWQLSAGDKTYKKPKVVYMAVAPGVDGRVAVEEAAQGEPNRFDKVRPRELVRAAVFDALTGQHDRHEGNVFISDDGKVKLIDHDKCFRPSSVGVSSLFIPNTKKWKLARKPGQEKASQNLDYSRHVAGGKIGTNYPKRTRKMLESIDSMESSELEDLTGLDAEEIGFLKLRAKWLLEDGFEDAVPKISSQMRARDKAAKRAKKQQEELDSVAQLIAGRLDLLFEGKKHVKGNLCVLSGSGTAGGFVACDSGDQGPGKSNPDWRAGGSKRGGRLTDAEFDRALDEPAADVKQLGGGAESKVFVMKGQGGEVVIGKAMRPGGATHTTSVALTQMRKDFPTMAEVVPKMKVLEYGGELVHRTKKGRETKLDGPLLLQQEVAPGADGWAAIGENERDPGVNRFASLDPKKVVKAAVLDVIMGQHGRHPGNVMLDGHGRLQMIDHDKAFSETDMFSSCFVPGTYHYDRHEDTAAGLLDYQKANGGPVGKKFSRGLTKMINGLADMGDDEIGSRYSLNATQAAKLKERVTLLRDNGMEATVDMLVKRASAELEKMAQKRKTRKDGSR